MRSVRASGNWMLALLLLAILAYITYNTLSTEGPGSRGVPDRQAIPQFAVPLAFADVGDDVDANLDPRQVCDPDRAAVHRADVFNSCDATRRGPLVVAFWATKSDTCKRQIDDLQRALRRHRGLRAVAVATKGSRDDVRATVRRRRWRLPVAWDRDGQLTNAFAVAVCPTITFVRRGGKVLHTSFGLLTPVDLEHWLARLDRT